LHMAKIGSGRIVLAKQPLVLGDLVQDVINEQRGDIDAAEHKLAVKIPQKQITLLADTHMLRMAIENLLSNAIKYTPKGGRITVRVYQDDNYAKVAISDSGIGIDPKDVDAIFRQFVRLEN